MEIKRTLAQNAVIQNRGGGLLVSAAAGSGKTSVLVDRLLERVIHENLRVDEFLIITFTKAAAEELRTRIAKAISQHLRQTPGNRHLQRQALLLYKAQISTIHSFCTAILREWGHLMDVPADFTLCEEQDATILMLQTLNDLLEKRYESVALDSDFARLLDTLSAGRDDSRLLDIVLDVFVRTQSHPDPAKWLEEQKALIALEGVEEAGETIWGRMLLSDTQQVVSYWIGELSRGMHLARGEESLAPYGENLGVSLLDLQHLLDASKEGWDAAAAACQVSFPRLKPLRNCPKPWLQEQVKGIRNNCKEAMEALASRFETGSEAILADMKLLRPAMHGLLDLVQEFSEAYSAVKAKKGLLDFADLEHKAVALLSQKDGEPTELAELLGSRFAEIMVDEYQDTNQVQNAIFTALSHQGRNLFLVGDVKQSIYRFRLADPTIFLEKYRRFLPYETAQGDQERKILLSQNFRSRPEVLSAVNDLFRNIMSEQLGEMNYTKEEALCLGGSFPEGGGYETELHVLDFKEMTAEKSTGQKPGKHELEARFVAGQIARLLEEGFLISDGEGGKRPVAPDDFAILLRSPGTVRQFYTGALQALEISWSSESDGNFFETTEVSVMLSFLQVIDNPRQDVPLVSVLHSPLYGFDGDRLAQIRLMAQGDLLSALEAAGEAGMADCTAFLLELEALRFGAGETSCHELIWKLYQRTNAIEIFRRMPGGAQREANLLDFYEMACRFERNGHRGLFGFLHHLTRLQEGGATASRRGAGEQAGVKILSIHRSKGLEYPVVFLCGLGKRFNYSDLQKPVLFHPKLGLGPRGLDPEQMVEFSTLPRQAVALQLKKELLAEEMRLLYVAMTRAKEKLVMTHALSYGESDLRKLAPYLSCPVDPTVLSGCSSVGQWILLAAMARPEGEVLRRIGGGTEPSPDETFEQPWHIRYHKGIPEARRAGTEKAVEDERQSPVFSREELWHMLNWRYPFENLAATPAKLTATQLSGEFLPKGLMPAQKPLEYMSSAGEITAHRPRFAARELGLTAAQRGSAFHTVMQSIHMDRTNSLEMIREELDRLVQEAYLTDQEAAAVQARKVYQFFSSSLGREMKRAQALHREFPFSILVPAGRYYPDMPEGETLLLQGVIDCWFETEEGITLVDFKTNRVSEESLVVLAEGYRNQLEAYAAALEEMTGKTVSRRILWFLTPNCGVTVGPENAHVKISG